MKKLAQRGIPINKEVMETAFPGCVWTRAHFARFLKDRGFVRTMEEGFQKYVGDEAPCFVPKEQIPPWEAVRLILECGGHPVLAHPLLYRLSPGNWKTGGSPLRQRPSGTGGHLFRQPFL